MPTKSEAQRISDDYDVKRSVRCPVCSKRLCPQRNGKIRAHHVQILVGTFLKSYGCTGSGRR